MFTTRKVCLVISVQTISGLWQKFDKSKQIFQLVYLLCHSEEIFKVHVDFGTGPESAFRFSIEFTFGSHTLTRQNNYFDFHRRRTQSNYFGRPKFLFRKDIFGTRIFLIGPLYLKRGATFAVVNNALIFRYVIRLASAQFFVYIRHLDF